MADRTKEFRKSQILLGSYFVIGFSLAVMSFYATVGTNLYRVHLTQAKSYVDYGIWQYRTHQDSKDELNCASDRRTTTSTTTTTTPLKYRVVPANIQCPSGYKDIEVIISQMIRFVTSDLKVIIEDLTGNSPMDLDDPEALDRNTQ